MAFSHSSFCACFRASSLSLVIDFIPVRAEVSYSAARTRRAPRRRSDRIQDAETLDASSRSSSRARLQGDFAVRFRRGHVRGKVVAVLELEPRHPRGAELTGRKIQ